MTNISLMLIYGGRSSEHQVSIMSAKNVYHALDPDKYDISICYIDEAGAWWFVNSVEESPSLTDRLYPVFGEKSFIVSPSGQRISPQLLMPIVHGGNGEDGAIQGMASLLDLPCVGPSLLSAAVTMDKDMTKRLLQFAGIPVVPWKTWVVQDRKPDYETITAELGTDLFVKPASAGSSFGVSHITGADQWEKVLDVASQYSELVLIEKTIDAREIEFAVLGNMDPEVSGPGEIIPGHDLFTFDDKYSEDSTAQTIIPAELPPETVIILQEYAKKAYLVTESRGMARIDFLVSKTGEVYLNEINSIPGFTNLSMYPKLWEHEGISQTELLDRLITLALEK